MARQTVDVAEIVCVACARVSHSPQHTTHKAVRVSHSPVQSRAHASHTLSPERTRHTRYVSRRPHNPERRRESPPCPISRKLARGAERGRHREGGAAGGDERGALLLEVGPRARVLVLGVRHALGAAKGVARAAHLARGVVPRVRRVVHLVPVAAEARVRGLRADRMTGYCGPIFSRLCRGCMVVLKMPSSLSPAGRRTPRPSCPARTRSSGSQRTARRAKAEPHTRPLWLSQASKSRPWE